MHAFTDEDLKHINRGFEGTEPKEIIDWMHGYFGVTMVMMSSFGADSPYALHYVHGILPDIRVIVLDPRFLFPQTVLFMRELEHRLKLDLKVFEGDMSPEEMIAAYGRLWEQGEEGVRKYHGIWKEKPLDRAFRELKAKACISGARRDQTRYRSENLSAIARRKDGVFMVYPFFNKNKADVDAYMQAHALPRHPLVAQGYESIGCRFLTKTGTGREGRKGMGEKLECGVHFGLHVPKSALKT